MLRAFPRSRPGQTCDRETERGADLGLPMVTRAPNVARGALWSALDFWTQQTMQLLTLIIVGNLVGPSAVGILSMGLVTITLMMTFLADGFSDALIQRERLTRPHFNAAFWLLLGLGCLAGLVLWAAAPPIAQLFSEPQLGQVLPLLAIGLPFISITATYQGLLQRELNFRLLAIRSVVSASTGFGTAILMAHNGFGVFSLVGFFLVSRILDAILIVLLSGVWPSFVVSRAALADIFDYGRHRVLNQMMGFLIFQTDRLVVAFFYGAHAVGLWSTAERLTSALTNGVSGVLSRVAFPVLSARRSDPVAIRRAIRQFILATNLIVMPVFVGIAVTGKEVIDILFSPAWGSAAPLLSLLALAAIPHATNFTLSAAVNARGRPDLNAHLALAVMILRIIGSLFAARYSVEAVAWANLVVNFLTVPMMLYSMRRCLAVTWVDILEINWAPALAVTILAAATLTVGTFLESQPELIDFAGKVVVGVVTYSVALYLFAYRVALREMSGAVGLRDESLTESPATAGRGLRWLLRRAGRG